MINKDAYPLKDIAKEYLLLSRMGEGSHAEVWKARHREFGYITALKILKSPINDQEGKVYRHFLEECKISLLLGSGNNDHIVRMSKPELMIDRKSEKVTEIRATVEMEFIKGRDLYSYLQENGQLTLPEAVNLLKGLASALAYCHHDVYEHRVNGDEDYDRTVVNGVEKPILKSVEQLIDRYKVRHNDIHSKNIIRRDDNGRYVLVDFGLAISAETDAKSSTRTKGNPEYKAPEKWDESATEITEQSDIYSYGILMYEALTGRVPFPENPDVHDYNSQLMTHHKQSVPPPIRQARSDCPAWMEHIVLRCLEKKPGDRYANGRMLFDAINTAMFKASSSRADAPDQSASAGVSQNGQPANDNQAERRYQQVLTDLDRARLESAGKDREVEAIATANGVLRLRLEELEARQRRGDRQNGESRKQRDGRRGVSIYLFALVLGGMAVTGYAAFRFRNTPTALPTAPSFLSSYASRQYSKAAGSRTVVAKAAIKMHGNRQSYSGEMKDGRPDGRGTVHFTNGDLFDGYLVNGAMEYGIYKWKADRNRLFQGFFADGKFHTGTEVSAGSVRPWYRSKPSGWQSGRQ